MLYCSGMSSMHRRTEEDKSVRVHRLNKHLESPLTKLVMHFWNIPLIFFATLMQLFN